MISFHTTLAILVLVCAAVFQAEAFTTTAKTRTQSTALHAGRRDFFGAAVSTTVGLIMAADVARAEDVADDLAMPSEEDQKKSRCGRCCRTVEKKGRIAKTKSSTHQLCRQFGQREGEAKRVTDVKGGTTQCYVRGTGPGMLVPPLSGKTLGYERIFHTNHLFRLHNDNELTENLITTNVRTPV
mmetsp:Transcript_26083/g.53645  ORF Transcript_26083/g.53645 Transcript_26083/m.53645 type:complete len:184 (+) Transcript_26083:126-677(+)